MSRSETDKPIRLIQLTDTHLYGDPSGKLKNMDTRHSFQQVLKRIEEREESIDLILATGDISHDGTAAAYQYFVSAMEQLGAAFRWIPGNHDNAKVMSQIGHGSPASDKTVRIGNWQLLLLDTTVDGEVHGMLADDELTFLESGLQQAETDDAVDHTLICLHHNPVPGNAGWMRDIGLHNKQAFWEILARSVSARAVVYGHIHQALDFEQAGIRCFCTPSTCIQFKPGVEDFALDQLAPGYRFLSLYADGSIDSAVHRVDGWELAAELSGSGGGHHQQAYRAG